MAPKIVLIGGFGFHDIGDESQLTTVLISLKRFISNAQFLVLSDNPEYSAKYHRVKTDYSMNHYLFMKTQNPFSKLMRRFKLGFLVYTLLRAAILVFNAQFLKGKKTFLLDETGRRFLNNLRSADLLFNVGGGNLNSIWRYGGLYSKCFTYLICKTFGKPVILSGQTVGPINSWLDRKLAGFVLNKVDVITLRDTMSKSVLASIGVDKPVIRETADDAVLLPCASQKEVEGVFLNEKIDDHHPLIGMNMFAFSHVPRTKLDKAKWTLAQIADYLIRELDARVVFVPMEYITGSDDRIAMSEVLELMEYKDKARIIKNEYDDKTLKGIIGQTDFAIGLRYHFIVFATTMQVPSIGLYLDQYYAMKMRGILEFMGQEKYACDLEKTSSSEIIQLVEDIVQNKDNIEKKLEEQTRRLGQHSLFTIEYAAKLLEDKR